MANNPLGNKKCHTITRNKGKHEAEIVIINQAETLVQTDFITFNLNTGRPLTNLLSSKKDWN